MRNVVLWVALVVLGGCLVAEFYILRGLRDLARDLMGERWPGYWRHLFGMKKKEP